MPAGPACPVGGERPLTAGETALVRSVFGTAIETAAVTIRRRKWFVLQARRTTMAPMGHLHFHPASGNYCDDFSEADLASQAKHHAKDVPGHSLYLIDTALAPQACSASG